MGKTKMCVHEASSGVLRWQFLDRLQPNRSVILIWSGINLKVVSGSNETRQTDKIQGISAMPDIEHCPHISLNFLEYDEKDFLLSRLAHVLSSPWPNLPNLSITNLQGVTERDITSSKNSKSLHNPNFKTEVCFLLCL